MVAGATEEARTLSGPAARRIHITGIVQGVGFRPFVYNLAQRHGILGWVRNTSSGVDIHAEGSSGVLDQFVSELSTRAPPLAHIESMTATDVAPNGYKAFDIIESQAEDDAYQLVSPDIATCADCLRELLDPADRRYGYPFINCTNCGPRFTIIEDIPYDRPKTTMRAFPMCPQCEAEYRDPANRRFHAQPNACPECGPHIWLMRPGQPLPAAGQGQDTRATIDGTRELLQQGLIVAIKGLGGFQLACDATNARAVQTLRERKRRPHKPFAVMVGSLQDARRHCELTEEEEALLTSPGSPIVLVRWRQGSPIVEGVAPGNRYLGVMLPYTPLHHLLLRAVDRPLVMTSGNLSEEPIARENDEALERLESIADAFLMHDRDIYMRYDDSVFWVPMPGLSQPIRRARGFAPSPVRLPFRLHPVLACGAELKNTFCLTRDQYAFVSQHIGDMENRETERHYEAAVTAYERLFRVRPTAIAGDMHPDYYAGEYARRRASEHGLPLIEVQHHHAHIASCLADNGWGEHDGRVIGVALDGTGYGTDGRIWGGEFLIADYAGFERRGRLEYLPLPGGDAGVHKPYRLAIATLYHYLKRVPDLPFLASVDPREVEIVCQMVDWGVNTPYTSSCGRLFDAVSALLDLCPETSYEAQAAIDLEMAAGDVEWEEGACYPFAIDDELVVYLGDMFGALVADIEQGSHIADISGRFHRTVAGIVLAMCSRISRESGLSTVVLSGGCFQNRQLLRLAFERLQAAGLHVLVHHQVPANDGGLSLGQALVAHAIIERKT